MSRAQCTKCGLEHREVLYAHDGGWWCSECMYQWSWRLLEQAREIIKCLNGWISEDTLRCYQEAIGDTNEAKAWLAKVGE